MKKNYLFAIGLLCSMAWMVGCSESDPTPDYSTPASDAIAFTCKYTWGEDNEMIWTDKTQIGLFCEQINNVNAPLTVTALSANQPEGTFYTKTAWAEGNYTFKIYAPYNKDNTSMVLSGMIPATQSQSGVSTTHIDQNALIYASVEASKSATPVKVDFKQVLNYLDVNVNTTKWQGWTPELITITTPNEMSLVGEYTFDLASDEFTLGATRSDSVAMTLSGATLDASGYHAYVVTTPFTTSTEVVCRATMNVAKDGEKTKALSGTVTIPANVVGEQVVAMVVDLDSFKQDVIDDTSINLCDPTGTGKFVTANCYVVGLPGQSYRFDATVMGNGYTTPAIADFTGTGTAAGIVPTVLAPKSAKLLWQTDPQLISGVKLSKKQVYFTLNGTLDGSVLTEGNAVIAVYSGEGGTGEILWSWHIWVTAADLDAKVQTYQIHSDYSSYDQLLDPVMMDRNLGATATGYFAKNGNNDATGTYYQWGRKDPFPGPGAGINAVSAMATYDGSGQPIDAMANSGDFTDAQAWKAVGPGKQITKADIAKFPMNFVATNNSPSSNWFEEVAADLWGNPLGSTAAANDIGHKSIYDPCPPGYRVPHAYAWSGFTNLPAGGRHTTTAVVKFAKTVTVWTDVTVDGGCDFLVNGVTIQYPFNGYMDYTKTTAPFANAGKRADYWTSAPNGANGSMFYAGDLNVNTPKGNGKAWGYTIRCMKEK